MFIRWRDIWPFFICNILFPWWKGKTLSLSSWLVKENRFLVPLHLLFHPDLKFCVKSYKLFPLPFLTRKIRNSLAQRELYTPVKKGKTSLLHSLRWFDHEDLHMKAFVWLTYFSHCWWSDNTIKQTYTFNLQCFKTNKVSFIKWKKIYGFEENNDNWSAHLNEVTPTGYRKKIPKLKWFNAIIKLMLIQPLIVNWPPILVVILCIIIWRESRCSKSPAMRKHRKYKHTLI